MGILGSAGTGGASLAGLTSEGSTSVDGSDADTGTRSSFNIGAEADGSVTGPDVEASTAVHEDGPGLVNDRRSSVSFLDSVDAELDAGGGRRGECEEL